MRLFRSPVARAALLGVSFALVTPALPLVQPALARSAPESFADLAAKLLPAVVNVSSTQTITAKNGPHGPDMGPDMPVFPPGSPFEQFFKDFLNRNRQGQGNGDNPPAARRAQSLGSGFIVDPSGLVVTNNHVIDDADQITVILHDEQAFKAKVVGRDGKADLALLKTLGLTRRQLEDLGVKRISTGGALASAAWAGFMRAAKNMAEHGRFDALTGLAPRKEIEGAFADKG